MQRDHIRSLVGEQRRFPHKSLFRYDFITREEFACSKHESATIVSSCGTKMSCQFRWSLSCTAADACSTNVDDERPSRCTGLREVLKDERSDEKSGFPWRAQRQYTLGSKQAWSEPRNAKAIPTFHAASPTSLSGQEHISDEYATPYRASLCWRLELGEALQTCFGFGTQRSATGMS